MRKRSSEPAAIVLPEPTLEEQVANLSAIVTSFDDALRAAGAHWIHDSVDGITDLHGRLLETRTELERVRAMKETPWPAIQDLRALVIRLRGTATEFDDLTDSVLRRTDVPCPPIAMILFCPGCHEQHVDADAPRRRHHTHLCDSCGHEWKPSHAATMGVRSLA